MMDAVKAYADKWAECDAIRREIKDELGRAYPDYDLIEAMSEDERTCRKALGELEFQLFKRIEEFCTESR